MDIDLINTTPIEINNKGLFHFAYLLNNYYTFSTVLTNFSLNYTN